MRLVWGTVQSVLRSDSGIQELSVVLSGSDSDSDVAICYPELCGECATGDTVLLNTTAVDLRLGTGGMHFVVARAGSGVAYDDPSRGHIMKLRYTPMQRDVLAVESPESSYHGAMAVAQSLSGMPVVCCSLHSHLPLVAAAVKGVSPALKVAYCMTDAASLALPFSQNARMCVDVGLLDATISCGQAFGGQLESVNLHSGLLAARHVTGADVAVVAIGPGVVGTTTPFGHGGVAQGEAINAAASLGGTPVAVLRLSFADPRERHRVVSHHSVTALSRVALAEAIVAIPELEEPHAGQVRAVLEDSGICSRHRCVTVRSQAEPDMRGLNVHTMLRGPSEDPAFFSAAYAAGETAARIALGEEL